MKQKNNFISYKFHSQYLCFILPKRKQLKTYPFEANSHDRIKMTKFWLDFDQKIFTPTNLNVGT